jgi:hypothetical protein
LETAPPDADQLTKVLVVPVTVAVNCCVPPAVTDASTGVIEIAIGTGFVVTVTVAVADSLESAALVAVTV